MTRLSLAIAALVSLSLLGQPAGAYEAPWCAVISMGNGSMYWDCQYRSFEACRPNVLAGNRGWCNPNPSWIASYAPGEPRHSRKRHARSQ